MKKVIALAAILMILCVYSAKIVWLNGFKYDYSQREMPREGKSPLPLDAYIYEGNRFYDAMQSVEETFNIAVDWTKHETSGEATVWFGYHKGKGSPAFVSLHSNGVETKFMVTIVRKK